MNKKLGMKVLHPGGLQATRQLAEKCDVSNDMTILDAGCGRGITSLLLAKEYGCRMVGVDIDPAALVRAHETARKNGMLDKVSFRIANLNSLPFTPDMFDGVIFQASLIFCDKITALKSVFQKIRPGGFLGAIELAWKLSPTIDIMQKARAVLCAAAANAEKHTEWLKLFERAGFKVLSGEVGHLGFTFRDMMQNEGSLSASRIALKCLLNKEARLKTQSVKNLFKETEQYLGYGSYACRKPTR